MLIFDGDYPMSYGAVDLDRDLTLPIDEVFTASPGQTTQTGWPDDQTMATLPEMRKGEVRQAAQRTYQKVFSTIFGEQIWQTRGITNQLRN